MADRTDVTTPDGRTLEVLTGGDPQGRPWLYHSGTPSGAVSYPWMEEVAAAQGLQMITYSRPGYGASTPRPHPEGGPRIVDDAADMLTILTQLGVEEFVTLGWSGGGPRALACAALMPHRCRAATTLAGVAPTGHPDLDWFEGMAPENQAEFAAAAEGVDAYAAYLEREFVPVLEATSDQLAEAMGELLTPVDRAALTDQTATYLADSFHAAGAQGVIGARDDGLAVLAPWGFDLADITVPVAVWQGREDAMVPYSHGVWLAEHVPGARAHLFDDEGHISLGARLDEILADLKALAGWA